MRIKIPKNGYQKFSAEKARVVAHLMADGCIFKTNHDYVMKYEVIDKDMLTSFENDMVKIYGLPLARGFNPSGKTGRLIPFVRLRSKIVFEDLMNYGPYYSHNWQVPDAIMNSSQHLREEFAKSFFDDKGSIIRSSSYPEVRLYSINFKGLLQMKELLEGLGLNSKIRGGFGSRRNVYAIIVKNINLFKQKIGFSSTRKKESLRKLIEGRKLPSNPRRRI